MSFETSQKKQFMSQKIQHLSIIQLFSAAYVIIASFLTRSFFLFLTQTLPTYKHNTKTSHSLK